MSWQDSFLDLLLEAAPSPNTIFLAEPYDNERSLREATIRDALKAYRVLVAEEQITNLDFLHKVIRQIQTADYGIADLTGHNPNVLLELGIMYGMRRPALLLLMGPETSTFPSNIKGIEQVRYRDYLELGNKLQNAMANVFQVTKSARASLDMPRLLNFLIDFYERLVTTRELMDGGFSSQIVHFRPYETELVAIINKGANAGLRTGVCLRVFSIGDAGVEEAVGDLILRHVQEKISVAAYSPHDLRHSFWLETLQGEGPILAPPAAHVVRPITPPRGEMVRQLTIDELRANLVRLKSLAKIMQ